jgi:L-ascorbate metabolism protein UlaG (beta-lactamase superfamily)
MPETKGRKMMADKLTANIHWLGHDSFRIQSKDLEIYIDPYRLQGNPPKADLILITHDHGDHCSPADVAKIQKVDTAIVAIQAAAAKLKGDLHTVRPGETLTVKGIPIQTVPAYNVNKFRQPGVPFHPPESGHVGYILTIEGVRIYHAGDTDFIPEMKSIHVDVALLPVSGTYAMTAEEAVQAADAIHPRVAVPMHVGRDIGDISAAQRFKQGASVPVEVLPME